MENFHPTLPGEFNNPCKSFFPCFLRFLLLIHFPFKGNRGGKGSRHDLAAVAERFLLRAAHFGIEVMLGGIEHA